MNYISSGEGAGEAGVVVRKYKLRGGGRGKQVWLGESILVVRHNQCFSPHYVYSEVMRAAEIHEEPDGPEVVRFIIVHCSIVHDVVLWVDVCMWIGVCVCVCVWVWVCG